jgi:hypothetical protein
MHEIHMYVVKENVVFLSAATECTHLDKGPHLLLAVNT